MNLRSAWVAWICGMAHEYKWITPLRAIPRSTVPANQVRNWKKFCYLMRELEKRAREVLGEMWMEGMGVEEALSAFEDIRSAVEVEGKKHVRRHERAAHLAHRAQELGAGPDRRAQEVQASSSRRRQ
jgi:hypothetical protein